MPYFTEPDLDKTLWRVLKEQSITLVNLQPYITLTESPLFNSESLLSGSMETFGSESFDIKGVLISENDNLTSIMKVMLKFPKYKQSVLNVVELPNDKTGWTAAHFYSILRKFNKEWKNDVQMDFSLSDKDGGYRHVLKATSSSPEKIELIKTQMQAMNKRAEEAIGLKLKFDTKISTQDRSETTVELRPILDTQQLFFTGKKKEMLTMLQALQLYVNREFSNFNDSTFILDYVL